MMTKWSFNRFILEPYQSDRAIKATTGSGFAMIQQKVAVKGFRVLVEFDSIVNGRHVHVPKGSVAYIKEEILFNAEWAKKHMECEELESKFMIVDPQFIEMIGKFDESPTDR